MERSADGLTEARIARDLRALGVEPGGTLMVHSSLSALGMVAGVTEQELAALDSHDVLPRKIDIPAVTSGWTEAWNKRWRGSVTVSASVSVSMAETISRLGWNRR